MVRLSRRRFLELAGASGAAVSLPFVAGCGDAETANAAARFFSKAERDTVVALAAAVIPEDSSGVGASGTGAVELIDRFLAAFENEPPGIYAGGPFSDRHAFPDAETGLPGDERPDNSFLHFLPLTRMQELAFRIELYGSDAVENGNINAPLVPPTPGLRTLYREAIATFDRFASEKGVADFDSLEDERRLEAFAAAAPEFQQIFLRHLAQGMFAAPEYGGNQDQIGWRDYDYDGDSQPLGYTLFDAGGRTFDRPDKPNQTADPARPPRPFSEPVAGFLEAITIGQGGKRFF